MPAVACWPGTIKAGRVSDATGMGADLLPTMAAIAGAKIPEGLRIDGVNLLPHLSEGTPLPERSLFWGVKRGLAIRKGDYKLITNEPFRNPSLYNLNTDLGEKNDLAKEQPEVVDELLQELKAWQEDVTKGVKQRT